MTAPRVHLSLMPVLALVAVLLVTFSSPARASTLPDNRAYELVTPPDKNGLTATVAFSAPSGDAVDWQSVGGCCGATTGGEELYQSRRGSGGWTTTGLTPTPHRSLEALFERQVPVFWTPDLSKTIYSTVESYDPADADNGALDLYLDDGTGEPIWLSRGPFGGTAPDVVTFDGASPDAKTVAFSTKESLTVDATGLNPNLTWRRRVLGVTGSLSAAS